MKRNFKDYLEDIVTHSEDIIEFTSELNYEEFSSNTKTVYAVIKCIENIAEAIFKVPGFIKRKYQHIDWREIRELRHELVHNYWEDNVDEVWEFIQDDIYYIKDSVSEILEDLDED